MGKRIGIGHRQETGFFFSGKVGDGLGAMTGLNFTSPNGFCEPMGKVTAVAVSANRKVTIAAVARKRRTAGRKVFVM